LGESDREREREREIAVGRVRYGKRERKRGMDEEGGMWSS
jgi:hypothetical protein